MQQIPEDLFLRAARTLAQCVVKCHDLGTDLNPGWVDAKARDALACLTEPRQAHELITVAGEHGGTPTTRLLARIVVHCQDVTMDPGPVEAMAREALMQLVGAEESKRLIAIYSEHGGPDPPPR